MRARSLAALALAASLALTTGAFAASASHATLPTVGGARAPVTTMGATGTAGGGASLTPPGQNLTTTGMNSLNSTTTTPNGGCRVGGSAVPSC